MRLRKLRDEIGGDLVVEERAFPLRPEPDPTVRFKGTYREQAWQRCATMSGPDVTFTPWPHDRFVAWSMPGLEAAKCVARQGEELFDTLHLRLFEAFFAKSRDIGDPAEVERIVEETGADMARFRAERDAGVGRQAVLDDYRAAITEGVRSIPTVIIPETGACLVGLTDLSEYRAAIEEAVR